MSHPGYPRVSEQTAILWAERGVNAAVVRLPQVHDPVKQGFVSFLAEVARRTGVSAYVGDGSNRWAAVHRSDAARLYRLALEAAGENTRGARYHAVGEEGIALQEIAEALGRALHVPQAWHSLRRVRDTPSQTALGVDERHTNVRGAFAVASARASRLLVEAGHVAVVDDVTTTGSTLAEIKCVLLAAGVKRVDLWAVARAPRQFT